MHFYCYASAGNLEEPLGTHYGVAGRKLRVFMLEICSKIAMVYDGSSFSKCPLKNNSY